MHWPTAHADDALQTGVSAGASKIKRLWRCSLNFQDTLKIAAARLFCIAEKRLSPACQTVLTSRGVVLHLSKAERIHDCRPRALTRLDHRVAPKRTQYCFQRRPVGPAENQNLMLIGKKDCSDHETKDLQIHLMPRLRVFVTARALRG